MLKFQKNKKIIIILLMSIITILVINFVVSNIIKNKITLLLLDNYSKYYTVNIEKVSFKLIERSLTINNVFFTPKSESIDKLDKGKIPKKSLEKISFSSIELDGIYLLGILFNNNIKINQLQLNDALIQKFKNDKIKTLKKEKKNSFDIDSIYLKKLNGFELDRIKVNNLVYQITDLSSGKIVFQNSPLNFNITGFKLEKFDEHYFKLKPVNNQFEISKIKIDFPDKKYTFSIEKISVNFENDIVNIKNVSYNPLINRVDLANSYQFNTDIFNLKIKELNLYNYDFSKTIENEGVFIDSISITSLDLSIYKDKRKPFDLNKRPKLPHLALKQMKMPLIIHKIKINKSKWKYEEQLKDKNLLMKVMINDINANISNITSIKSFRENPLMLNLNGKFMGHAKLHLSLNLPLKNNQNKFYFNGSIGSSKFKLFDSAIYPTLGLKILNGNIDKLTFDASADNFSSNGKMTFLYHDLEAEVFKSHSMDENKFLSWTVNTILHKSNPGHNKKVREAVMQYDRVIYKGLGNYIWKTLQSGIVNTIIPRGKTTDKLNAKKKRKEKRKQRKNKN